MTPEQIQALFEQTARQTQATQQQVDANARAITELRESLNQTDQQIQATQQQVNANGRAIAANDRAIAELRQSIGQTNQAVDVLVGVSSGLMSRMDGLIERLDRGQSTAEIQAESIRELVKYLNRALIHRGQLGSLP